MQESLFQEDDRCEQKTSNVMSQLQRDRALEGVVREILRKGRGSLEERFAHMFRASVDEILDGRRTMRFDFSKVSSVEKSYLGAKVEILAREEFDFGHGLKLDYMINGHEVDAKFSATGAWMIAPKNVGEILLVMQASEETSLFSVGVVRACEDLLRPAPTRDSKRSFSATGKDSITWLIEDAQYPRNQIMELFLRAPRAIEAIFASSGSGQQRVNELFRRLQGVHVHRTTVQTVAAQEDSSKRVRDARNELRDSGILILGYHRRHREIASALGIERISQGEWVSVKVFPAEPSCTERQAVIDGVPYRLARIGDGTAAAPNIPPENGT
ncbi:NaeI family type II restriction endonuclease [Streptomyces sp. NPDC059759]|uniref:NaeI family type II restriction endonuclease n=1 Tax=Streptomyces sp. NPDC059759 TaxID=3346936 RepID=UPI003658D7AB